MSTSEQLYHVFRATRSAGRQPTGWRLGWAVWYRLLRENDVYAVSVDSDPGREGMLRLFGLPVTQSSDPEEIALETAA